MKIILFIIALFASFTFAQEPQRPDMDSLSRVIFQRQARAGTSIKKSVSFQVAGLGLSLSALPIFINEKPEKHYISSTVGFLAISCFLMSIEEMYEAGQNMRGESLFSDVD